MFEKIYDNSPIFIQNLMVSFKGIQLVRQRYNKYYKEEFNYLKNLDNEFKVQEIRLNEFLKFVGENSEFYAHFLKEINFPYKIDDLQKLPLTDKEILRENINKIVTRKSNLISMKTGGSTGKSLIYYTHSKDISKKIAYLDYFKYKNGVKKGNKRVSIGGRSIVPFKQKRKIFWRYNIALNQLLLSSYHADGENLKYYIDKLNDFKPVSIDGFTTVIHRLAMYILTNNIELSFVPKAIFPTAEALTDEMKRDIEKAFGCPVLNQYASSEGAPFITEDINGNYQICPATGIYELIHVQDKIYELVVTSFYTTTTPLIRYKIGDSVELYDELPNNYNQEDIKIKRIIGRNNDFLYSNERGIVTNVNLSTVIRDGDGKIIDSQFVQNSLEQIEVYLVLSENVNKEKLESKLTASLNVRFGNSTNYIFYYVDKIEQTVGGKTRFTINNIKEGR